MDETTYKNAYLELVKAIETIREKYNSSQTDNYPTAAWVAGKFQQLSYLPAIESSLRDNLIDNPEKQEEYEKFIALKDISLKYGLVKKAGNKYVKTDNGSKFVQAISRSLTSWKDLATKFRDAGASENQEWLNSLSDEDKKLVNLYSELKPKEYAFLMGLVEKQQSKTNYTDRIDVDSPLVSRLQDLNLIKPDYTLNIKLINAMLNFLNEKTYARLKAFNKDISYITDRISADRALMRNFLERNLDRSSHRRNNLASSADEIIDSLTDADRIIIKSAYKGKSLNKQELSRLQQLNILTGNDFTELGKYIASILTSNADLDKLSASGEKPTQYSRIRKSDSEEFNQASRSQDKAYTKNLSFKNFIKNTHKH